MCEFLNVFCLLFLAKIHFPRLWLIYVHEKRTFRHKFWFYWNFYLPFSFILFSFSSTKFLSLEATAEEGFYLDVCIKTYMNMTSVEDFSSSLKVIGDIFHVINMFYAILTLVHDAVGFVIITFFMYGIKCMKIDICWFYAKCTEKYFSILKKIECKILNKSINLLSYFHNIFTLIIL